MKAIDLAFGAYALLCLAAITWPGFALLGANAEGFVLGIPFALVWNVGWVSLTFVVLAVYHRLR